MSDPLKVDQERSAQLDNLVSAIGTADAETLVELRQFLLDEMFPSMPESVRDVVLPLFELVTLDTEGVGTRQVQVQYVGDALSGTVTFSNGETDSFTAEGDCTFDPPTTPRASHGDGPLP